MPELPEVETFRRKFLWGSEDEPSLVGKRILGVDLLWRRTLAEPDPTSFSRRIKGQTITDIDRRGKYLLLRLSSDVLAIHLRMSGDLFLEAGEAPLGVHHRLLLNLDDGSRLVFSDTRKLLRRTATRALKPHATCSIKPGFMTCGSSRPEVFCRTTTIQ